jgi:hypothetical protein
MTKQKFDFNAINNTVKSTTTNTVPELTNKNDKFEIKMIPRHKIRSNKLNTYSVTDIEILMKSILNFGLLQNLLAVYSMDDDVYILEAGHRRLAALDKLIDIFSDPEAKSCDDYQLYKKNVSMYEAGYPIKVSGHIEDIDSHQNDIETIENISDSMLESEIRLHVTNQDIRKETTAEKAKNIQRYSKLLQERNRRLNKSDRVNVNETIGKQFGITKRQVTDIKATENLIPELQKKFENGKMTLKNAAAYSRLDEKEQKAIDTLIEHGHSISAKEISKIQDQGIELSTITQIKENTDYGPKEKANEQNTELALMVESLKVNSIKLLRYAENKENEIISQNYLETIETAISIMTTSIERLKIYDKYRN